MIKSLLGALSGFFGLLNRGLDFFRDKRLIHQGRKEEKLKRLEKGVEDRKEREHVDEAVADKSPADLERELRGD